MIKSFIECYMIALKPLSRCCWFYDGITASAPRIGLFFCTYTRTVVTSGPHLLLHFSSDDYYNFAGFEASYATGERLLRPSTNLP